MEGGASSSIEETGGGQILVRDVVGVVAVVIVVAALTLSRRRRLVPAAEPHRPSHRGVAPHPIDQQRHHPAPRSAVRRKVQRGQSVRGPRRRRPARTAIQQGPDDRGGRLASTRQVEGGVASSIGVARLIRRRATAGLVSIRMIILIVVVVVIFEIVVVVRPSEPRRTGGTARGGFGDGLAVVTAVRGADSSFVGSSRIGMRRGRLFAADGEDHVPSTDETGVVQGRGVGAHEHPSPVVVVTVVDIVDIVMLVEFVLLFFVPVVRGGGEVGGGIAGGVGSGGGVLVGGGRTAVGVPSHGGFDRAHDALE